LLHTFFCLKKEFLTFTLIPNVPRVPKLSLVFIFQNYQYQKIAVVPYEYEGVGENTYFSNEFLIGLDIDNSKETSGYFWTWGKF